MGGEHPSDLVIPRPRRVSACAGTKRLVPGPRGSGSAATVGRTSRAPAFEQQLPVLDRGNLMVIYPVSTSKFGLGDWPGSYRTPLGELEVTQKIGDGLARSTADSPGRDPIVTR